VPFNILADTETGEQNTVGYPANQNFSTTRVQKRQKEKQIAQLSQRDRAAGWAITAKSGRLELEDNILQTL